MSKKKILKEILESRKSSYPKDFSNKKIADKVVQKILDSAEFTPNHKRTKPWRFQIFRENRKAELVMALAKAYQSASNSEFSEKKLKSIEEKFSQTDTIISVSVDYSGKVPQWEELAATAMAVQNMYLTCTVHKVGCYLSTPKEAEYLKDFLNLEENQMCLGLFYMGKLQKYKVRSEKENVRLG